MRFLLTAVLVLALAGVASATNPRLTNHQPAMHKGQSGSGEHIARQGGDGFGNATLIPGLPYTDSGNTCGYAHDWTMSCGYAYTDPDVVYFFTAGSDPVTISLCGSDYDTEVAVVNAATGAEVACNDDFCGLQSQLDCVPVTAGTGYYIVIGGFSSACGNYLLNVSNCAPCVVTCPPGAQQEGEPTCYDGYYDTYNGGCNSSGWTDLFPLSGTSADMCGTSGTYLYNGLSYRDTDWYLCYAAGPSGAVTATCTASFPVQLILIYGANCANLQYTYTTSTCGVPAVLSWQFAGPYCLASSAPFWMWVGGSQFSGIPCGSNYVLHMDGVCSPGLATEPATWGTVKGLYR